ncbi:hypothetical protein Droror1_Dr00011721 [Drosera rotundifolia]
MEQPQEGSAAAVSAPSSQCDECKSNPSKYKCPGCSLRTCSLNCVKSHKLRSNCSGKRDLSRVVPISEFDDSLLLSDYHMLEDVKRVAESARRTRMKLCVFAQYRLPSYLKGLQNAAASRRTRLLFLPSGMSRRQRNQTRYDHRKKLISWTIEWRFHSTDVVLLDHGILESSKLHSVIEKHLQPSPWNHKLKKFCEEELENLKFFIRKYPKARKSPFRELDIDVSVKELLSNLAVLEYPVIYVFLPSHTYDFEVTRDIQPAQPKPDLNRQEKSHLLRPGDDTFKKLKEEEIDDESDLDPEILDLLKGSELDSFSQTYCQHQQAANNPVIWESPALNFPVNENLGSEITGSNGYLSNTNMEEILGFDFEQDLVDEYSHMISDCNLDEFLDLSEVTEGTNDLEEGEIPSTE